MPDQQGTARRALQTLKMAAAFPLLVCLRVSNQGAVIQADVTRWYEVTKPACSPGQALLWFLARYPEFRTLFYYRLRRGNLAGAACGAIAGFFYRGERTLHLASSEIGPGLFIQHGFATIVAARRVGANCWINQQVTIGFDSPDRRPVLGDGVSVHAGAKVLGEVTIGDGARIGANAVVLTDVPPGCTAVGVPARILPPKPQRAEQSGPLVQIYWFWPYVHADQLVLPAAVPRAGDRLVLHTMRDRIAAADVDGLPIELAATLATPKDHREKSLAWTASRATTYVQRVAQRHQALRTADFDVCHIVFSNYFTDGIDFRLLARRAPSVWEVHDIVPHQSRIPHRVERRILALLYSAPGAIIVRHEFVRDGLVREFGVDRDRINVVPWHVPVVPGVERLAPNAHRRVLFFGTLRRNKGVDVLLRAIEQLRDRDDVSFVFAGRGFPDIEQQIRDAATRDTRIQFEPGYVTAERKHDLYSAADVVVLPYTAFASTSAVLCDAYAYHLPVVATDVGGLGASVRSDESGWVVPPADADALAAAIDGALRDGAAWLRAARRARDIAADRTPERTAATLRALYDDIS